MNHIAQFAADALNEELLTYPKPGLVSDIDNGSHMDMDYALFLKSIDALKPYFLEFTNIGSQKNHSFNNLRQIGIAAENAMIKATNNINTHRGSIFVLGILIAATAYCLNNYYEYSAIEVTIKTKYQTEIRDHTINPNSHGAKIRKQYQLESILENAANGFPEIFKHLIAFRQFKNLYEYNDAKVCLFLLIMSSLDDTNLVHRGGIEALYYAKNTASEILQQRNIQNIKNDALNLHQEFIFKNLSAGGAADILAAVIFLDKVESLWH